MKSCKHCGRRLDENGAYHEKHNPLVILHDKETGADTYALCDDHLDQYPLGTEGHRIYFIDGRRRYQSTFQITDDPPAWMDC